MLFNEKWVEFFRNILRNSSAQSGRVARDRSMKAESQEILLAEVQGAGSKNSRLFQNLVVLVNCQLALQTDGTQERSMRSPLPSKGRGGG